MEDASESPYLENSKFNPHYCPKTVRLWLSASFCAGNVKEEYLKARLREGSVICWKDAHELVEAQRLNMEAQWLCSVAVPECNLSVRLLYLTCDSYLQRRSEPLMLNALWLSGMGLLTGEEHVNWAAEAGSWRPQCLVITNSASGFLVRQAEFVSGLEALFVTDDWDFCCKPLQRLRVLHLDRIHHGKEIPECLGLLPNLETLILSRVIPLCQFPATIRKLSSLRQLCLISHMACYEMPYWLSELVKLEKVYLECATLPLYGSPPPSLRALSLKCSVGTYSLNLISNVQSLEKLSLWIPGGAAHPLAITALTGLTALKLLGACKYELPEAFSIRHYPRLKLLRLSPHMFESLDKRRRPKMKEVRRKVDVKDILRATANIGQGSVDVFYEATAPFNWADSHQSMNRNARNVAGHWLPVNRQSRGMRGAARTCTEGTDAEAENEDGSGADTGAEQIRTLMPDIFTYPHGLIGPAPSCCSSPHPLDSSIGGQPTLEQPPEPLPEPELNVESACEVSSKPLPEPEPNVERAHEISPVPLPEPEPNVECARSTSPKPLPEPEPNVECARKISPDNKMAEKMRMVVSAVDRLGEIPRMLEDMSKDFELRDVERVSAKVEDRYDAVSEELSGLCKLLGIDRTTLQRLIPDNEMMRKMSKVVTAMERLGEIPKILQDMSINSEPRDLQRMSAKMEDRYEALREELCGLCKLLGIDITALQRLTPDNEVARKIGNVVYALEHLGEIPKMLQDRSKSCEPKDLERISIKMEDRYDSLREELSGLCGLVGIDIATLLRAKD